MTFLQLTLRPSGIGLFRASRLLRTGQQPSEPGLQLLFQDGRGQALGQGFRQLDTVASEDHEVHGREELFQAEAAVLRDVGQLPYAAQLVDGQPGLFKELLGQGPWDDPGGVGLHVEELGGVVVELLPRDLPDAPPPLRRPMLALLVSGEIFFVRGPVVGRFFFCSQQLTCKEKCLYFQ